MEMKRDVLFIHGGGEGAHEADEKLAQSLRDALGGGYEVRSPEMPDEGSPEVEAWKGEVAAELAALDGEAILVGHSVGAHILLKFLSEEDVEKPVAGLFLVAAPYAGTGGWELEKDALPEDFASSLPEGLTIFFYHGRDDEEVPFAHLALYKAKLPEATFRAFGGRGHQFGDDLSEVARDILENERWRPGAGLWQERVRLPVGTAPSTYAGSTAEFDAEGRHRGSAGQGPSRPSGLREGRSGGS